MAEPKSEFTHLRTIADPIGAGDADLALSNGDLPALDAGSISTGPGERTLEFYYDIVDAAGASQAGGTMTASLNVVRRNRVEVLRGTQRVINQHTVDSLYETVRPRRVCTITVGQSDRLSILANTFTDPVASVAIEIFYREVKKP